MSSHASSWKRHSRLGSGRAHPHSYGRPAEPDQSHPGAPGAAVRCWRRTDPAPEAHPPSPPEPPAPPAAGSERPPSGPTYSFAKSFPPRFRFCPLQRLYNSRSN